MKVSVRLHATSVYCLESNGPSARRHAQIYARKISRFSSYWTSVQAAKSPNRICCHLHVRQNDTNSHKDVLWQWHLGGGRDAAAKWVPKIDTKTDYLWAAARSCEITRDARGRDGSGVESGWAGVDRGWREGDLGVVRGRPSADRSSVSFRVGLEGLSLTLWYLWSRRAHTFLHARRRERAQSPAPRHQESRWRHAVRSTVDLGFQQIEFFLYFAHDGSIAASSADKYRNIRRVADLPLSNYWAQYRGGASLALKLFWHLTIRCANTSSELKKTDW